MNRDVVISLLWWLMTISAFAVTSTEFPSSLGDVKPYVSTTPDFGSMLSKYELSAHVFIDKISEKKIPFLLYLTKQRLDSVRKVVPLIVYFSGSGECGDDLSKQFSQTDIFDIVGDCRFQKKHPACLLAPMLPNDETFHSGMPNKANALVMAMSNLVATVVGRTASPKIDPRRVYITGLSYGGSAAFEFPCYLPNTFAASVPVSSFMNEFMIPDSGKLCFWLIHDRGIRENDNLMAALKRLEKKVLCGGGDFRYSEYPNVGHSAWHRAWMEPEVWDWVFSKKLDIGNNNRVGMRCLPVVKSCSSSIESIAASKSCDCAVDGLESTYYEAKHFATGGDWFEVLYAAPVRARFRIVSGLDLEDRSLYNSDVLAMNSKGSWVRVGAIRCKKGGDCFDPGFQVHRIKIVVRSKKLVRFVIREVVADSDCN